MPAAASSRPPDSAAAVLTEAFGRFPGLVDRVLGDLPESDLTRRVDPDANTIAWLVWHTARMQDAQVTAAKQAIGREEVDQVWAAAGFDEQFALDVDEDDIGYGMAPEDVDKIRVSAEQLRAYHRAVTDDTLAFVASLGDADFGAVVDENWDPPVTLMSRLVSVEQDAAQHLGQAAYVRGVLQRT